MLPHWALSWDKEVSSEDWFLKLVPPQQPLCQTCGGLPTRDVSEKVIKFHLGEQSTDDGRVLFLPSWHSPVAGEPLGPAVICTWICGSSVEVSGFNPCCAFFLIGNFFRHLDWLISDFSRIPLAIFSWLTISIQEVIPVLWSWARVSCLVVPPAPREQSCLSLMSWKWSPVSLSSHSSPLQWLRNSDFSIAR